jgi:uncharacterized repeat protein (TIGR01451 family)
MKTTIERWVRGGASRRSPFVLASIVGTLVVAGCGGSSLEPTGKSGQPLVLEQGSLALDVSVSGATEVGRQTIVTAVFTNPGSAAVNVDGAIGVSQPTASMLSARASAGHCTRNGPGNFICFFGDVAPGATVTVTAVVVPSAAEPLTFGVGVFTDSNDVTEVETDPVTIAPAPTDVQITGSASTGSPPEGAAFNYTFQVKNNGPFSASAVTFTDTLPDALPVGAVSAPAGVSCATAGQTITCVVGDLVVGAQANIVVGTTAPASPATISDIAAVSEFEPDSNPANGSVAVTVQVK